MPVSAVAGDVLTEQSVTQATDLTRLIPSIQVAPAALFYDLERVEVLMSGGSRLTAAVDTRIESSCYLSIDFLDLGKQDGDRMSNARITWEQASGQLALTAYVNNLEDELVFSNSLQSPAKPGVIYNQMRPPRTYGVRAAYRF